MNIVLAVCPDFDFETRKVVPTADSSKWYMINWNLRELYIPTESYMKLHLNVVQDVTEAICNFNISEPEELQWNYHMKHIQTSNDLEIIMKHLMEENDLRVTCDIETCDTSWSLDNRILAIGFSCNGPNTVYVCTDEALSPKGVAILQKFFDREDYTFTWHNGKFDKGRLSRHLELKVRVDEDTMLMHYVGINERRGTHGLKHLAPLYLNAPDWDAGLQKYKKEFCSKNKIKMAEFTYDLIPTDILLPYLCLDVIATCRLRTRFAKLMAPESIFIYKILIKAANTFAEIEETGMLVDQTYLTLLHIELIEEIEKNEDVVAKISGELWDPIQYMKDTGAKGHPGQYFNHKSPAQLKWLLYRTTGIWPTSTNADYIEELTSQVKDSEFLNAIHALRKLNKQLGTYVEGMRNQILEDSRIRCSFNLHGTETGRLSSSDPNLHNIPRDPKIKNMFVAAEGNILVQLDYSQSELRVLAYLSKDEWLTNIYKTGEDLHDAIALKIFGKGFSKEDRVIAKTVNFGIAYGRGPQSLSKEFDIPMYDAKEMIRSWYSPMPGVKKWIAKTRADAVKATAPSTPFGRSRHFIVTSMNRYAIENEAVNFPIQSIASDLTLLSVIQLHEVFRNDENIKIVNTVHDSIIFEVKNDPEVIQNVIEVGKKVMSTVPQVYLPDCKLPFAADAEVGHSWGALIKNDM